MAAQGAGHTCYSTRRGGQAAREKGEAPVRTRLCVVFALFLAVFGTLVCSLTLTATNRAWAASAQAQSVVSLRLDEGRGNLFDCNFTRLTGTQTEPWALYSPGKASYRELFSEVDSSQRADFYSGIQRVQPFLLPASEKAVANAQQAADASGARYLFYKPLRYYSCPIAPHLVGYLDADGAGVSGVEAAFDELLRGGSTALDVACTITAQGTFALGAPPQLVETQGTGAGVMLALDARIQRLAEGIAAEEMDKGSIVVMETATGRVRASVSMPTFNPLNVAASFENENAALVNRSTAAFAVGSVFKPLVAAAALDAGFSKDEVYTCTGSITLGGHTYRCAKSIAHGEVDMQKALAESCNCYFVALGQRLGGEAIRMAAQRAGFGAASVVGGTLTTASGALPSAQLLQDRGELANFSFGQGAFTATPVQIAAFTSVFANGGTYISPTFTEAIVDEYSESVTQSLYAPVQRGVCSSEAAAQVLDMMRAVVTDGIGRAAQPVAGGAAGKTGTAQTGRYTEDGEELVNAWFTGLWPSEAPRYTITVLLDEGAHSSTDAARIFSRMASALYSLEEKKG